MGPFLPKPAFGIKLFESNSSVSRAGDTGPVEVSIRKARRDDVAAIVRLLRDDPLGAEREAAEGESDAAYVRAFEAIDADERQLLCVAEHDGRIVGTLQVSFIPCMTFRGGERAQLEGVRVDSSVRGAGVGRQMVAWAVDRAQSRGCHVVQLTTNKRRSDAHRFYEALGFRATHEGMKLPL